MLLKRRPPFVGFNGVTDLSLKIIIFYCGMIFIFTSKTLLISFQLQKSEKPEYINRIDKV